MKRKGLGKGQGNGYKNIIPIRDKKVHSDSARGRKQPQTIINLQRVAYGNPKTPIQLREYQMGVGMPVGTIKEYEDLFKNKNVRLDIPLNIKEKIEVTKKLKLKDSDKDGVADILDCEPNNINKQDDDNLNDLNQQDDDNLNDLNQQDNNNSNEKLYYGRIDMGKDVYLESATVSAKSPKEAYAKLSQNSFNVHDGNFRLYEDTNKTRFNLTQFGFKNLTKLTKDVNPNKGVLNKFF
jgi:hypothetical protein